MTKIDDEMVERAVSAYLLADEKLTIEGAMRAGLEAALSPKPEPEIEVSEGMRKAGFGAWRKAFEMTLAYDDLTPQAHRCLEEVFRAMESTRLKEAQEGAAYAAKDAPQGVNAAAPVKETGRGRSVCHRRVNDPYWHTYTHTRKDES